METTIAITVWQSRISPVFDTARRMLIVNINGVLESGRTERSIEGLSLSERVNLLAELDVDVLLCGAISRPLADMVASSGIRVIPWIKGETDDVLQWYLTGKPIDPRMLMPGCRQRRRRFQNRHRSGSNKCFENRQEEVP